jgi:hypothetical protein
MNVLSRNPPGIGALGDIYPGGGGEGGVPSVVCLYYRQSLFKLFSTNSRKLAERICNVVRNRKREHEDHGEYWDG